MHLSRLKVVTSKNDIDQSLTELEALNRRLEQRRREALGPAGRFFETLSIVMDALAKLAGSLLLLLILVPIIWLLWQLAF